MSKKIILPFVLSILLLALILNLQTIHSFPSWFDEAVFANISINLSYGNGLTLDLIPGYINGQVLIYGPIYFYLQAILIKFFYLQEFIFRLPNFIAAYVSIILISRVLYRNGLGGYYSCVFFLASILDVSINRNLVGGRMDMLAVMFVSLSLCIISFQPIKKRGYENLEWFLIGLLCSAAYLTTPRALFLLPVVLVVSLNRLSFNALKSVRRGKWLGLILCLFAFILPIGIWVDYVGGIQAYTSLFSKASTKEEFIAPSFFRSSYDNIAIGLMMILVLFNYKLVLKNELLIGLFITYLTFSLFVREVGPYAAMIMPFVLAIIILLISKSSWGKLLKWSMLTLIIFPGLILLGLRTADIYLNANCRDASKFIDVLNQSVGLGNNIVAPFKYYFLLEAKDRNLVTLEYSKDDKESLVQKSNLVVSDIEMPIWINSLGFRKAGEVSCNPIHVPLLPATFYQRSTYNEGFYVR